MDRVLITGASGFLGSHLGVHLANSGHDVLGLFHTNTIPLPFRSLKGDVSDREALLKRAEEFHPTAIVHAAALSRVIDCEREPELARRVNILGTTNVAEVARSCKAYLILLSTDQVFDGHRALRKEGEAPCPTHEYGRCKAEAERLAMAVPDSLVLRSNNIVGRSFGWGSSFTDGILAKLVRGETAKLFTDQFRSPIHVKTMAEVIHRCIAERKSGVLHAGGPERMSRFETGLALARAYGYPESSILPESMTSHPQQALLHRDGSFDTSLLRSNWADLGSEKIAAGLQHDALEGVR